MVVNREDFGIPIETISTTKALHIAYCVLLYFVYKVDTNNYLQVFRNSYHKS